MKVMRGRRARETTIGSSDRRSNYPDGYWKSSGNGGNRDRQREAHAACKIVLEQPDT
jgi:hypothetical protein